MKTVRMTTFGLIGLLIIVAIVFALGVDVRLASAPIIRQIESATGYRVQVDGPIRIALGPFLGVVADDVRIADVNGAAEEALLTADRVKIGVSVISLIGGNVRISDLTMQRPTLRLDHRQVDDRPAGQLSKAGIPWHFMGIDQVHIVDGNLMFSTPQGALKTLLDGIQVTAKLSSVPGLDVSVDARRDGQRVHASATTDGPLTWSDGPAVTMTAAVSSVDAPPWSASMTGKLSVKGQALQLDEIRGTTDQDPFGGSASFDLSKSTPHLNAEINFTRLRVARTVSPSELATGHRDDAGGQVAGHPWSNAPVDLSPLNLFSANVKLSADDLIFGRLHIAPAFLGVTLVRGVAVAEVSRTGIYDGRADGALVLDATGQHPRCIVQMNLSKVAALALLEDTADFDHLDGHIDAKFDLKATGESVRAMLSTLSGTADIEVREGMVRGVNLPKMVKLLTKNSLQGWDEDGNTKLDSLGASFRIEDGVATTNNLRAVGPLVSITGKGSVNLVDQNLDFITDPKLNLTLDGQGRSDGPVGLGVPVVVRGPWSNPQIYPDVANILDNPDDAYAKLAGLGEGLFGLAKKQGFSLDSILDGVGSILGGSEQEPPAAARPKLAGPKPEKPGPVEHPSTGVEDRHQLAQEHSRVRVALVIGNAHYLDGEPLAQPIKDARDMAEELRKVGFDVIEKEDLAKQAIANAIETFKAKVKPGSAALIFFSGFGIQSERRSYMLPVDAQIYTERDVGRDGVSLEQVLADIDTLGAAVKIAIIDAARKNPFEWRYHKYSSGLSSIDAPSGTLVLSAAAPGRMGIDDRAGGGLFIAELLRAMRSPGMSAEEVFSRTRTAVAHASNNEQIPWMSSSLSEAFYFDATRPNPPVDEPVVPSKADSAESNKPQDCPRQVTDRLSDETNESLRRLDDAIKGHPEDVEALYRRGLIYAENQDYERAVAGFSEVIRLDPSDADAFNNRCWTRAILGQLQEALEDCDEALRLRPSFTDAFDSRGLTQLKLGHYEKAISDFNTALQSNPKQVSSLYGRGKAKLSSGDDNGGQVDIKKAKKMDPTIVDDFAKYCVR